MEKLAENHRTVTRSLVNICNLYLLKTILVHKTWCMHMQRLVLVGRIELISASFWRVTKWIGRIEWIGRLPLNCWHQKYLKYEKTSNRWGYFRINTREVVWKNNGMEYPATVIATCQKKASKGCVNPPFESTDPTDPSDPADYNLPLHQV